MTWPVGSHTGEPQPITKEELLAAATAWQPGKTTGPDGISYESLRAILERDDWAEWLCELFTGALRHGEIPPQWTRSLTVLLPKRPLPLVWGDTRPITLSSVVLKVMAQILQRRLETRSGRPPSSSSLCVGGRWPT